MALEIAKAWAGLPIETFQAALAALEPQLVREHDLRILEQRRIEQEGQRKHRLAAIGLFIGSIIAIISIGAAIYFGISQNFWAMALVLGPTAFVMIKVFVLRKSDPEDARALTAVFKGVGRAG
ncbi:hypothetical protein ABT247_06145 [Kitasatospora sp. NPDC001539]|uniref:hypothetical protein n=1 Tax=Kitasatospora sp. NPDC001539 TaxID=3154384 RepID=UPI0033342676